MWIDPKTNWTSKDVPLPGDFNRIEGDVKELKNEIVEIVSENINQPCFSVYASEGFSVYANSTAIVRFNRSRINQQNKFDLTSNKFVPARAGIYCVKAQILFVTAQFETNEYATLCVYKNETKIDEKLCAKGVAEIVSLIEIGVDDYLSFRIINNSSKILIVSPSLPELEMISSIAALGFRLI